MNIRRSSAGCRFCGQRNDNRHLRRIWCKGTRAGSVTLDALRVDGANQKEARMVLSAVLLLIVIFALPAVLDHGGSFREVDDERER